MYQIEIFIHIKNMINYCSGVGVTKVLCNIDGWWLDFQSQHICTNFGCWFFWSMLYLIMFVTYKDNLRPAVDQLNPSLIYVKRRLVQFLNTLFNQLLYCFDGHIYSRFSSKSCLLLAYNLHR